MLVLMLYLFSYFYLILYFFLVVCFFFSFYLGGFLVDFYFFSFGPFDVSLAFVFDYLSFGFFGCVSFISGMVFYYVSFYMEGSLDMRRFVYTVFFFVVSMFFLVFSGNFFFTMIGWDGLGLVSFCLVVFYNNSSSLDSGLVTFFTNRLGDVFFLVSFFFFCVGGSWSFDFFSYSFPSVFLYFLFFGAITKRAQVPFSAWLPAAMAAPTPVSSLVHSSTLVTAGVYVLIRYHYLFFYCSWFFKCFSLFTMFLAGFCACLEKDFKKVIAMSTLSQLGIMLFILSVGSWMLSFLHIVIHAFFKSTLFLRRGILISQSSGGQDSRFYGGFFINGGSFSYFLVSCLSLSGFPFVIGFYSKDLIISRVMWFNGGLLFGFFVFSCFLTVLYRIRLVSSGFVGFYKGSSHPSLCESFSFFFPVNFLFFVCCFSGSLFSWFFLSSSFLFYRGFDLFIGLIVISFCLFVSFFSLRVGVYFSYFFSNISFLRFISTGGFSRWFPWMTWHVGDSRWIESLGGRGFYSSLFLVGDSFSVFFKMGVKGILLLSIFGGVFFVF